MPRMHSRLRFGRIWALGLAVALGSLWAPPTLAMQRGTQRAQPIDAHDIAKPMNAMITSRETGKEVPRMVGTDEDEYQTFKDTLDRLRSYFFRAYRGHYPPQVADDFFDHIPFQAVLDHTGDDGGDYIKYVRTLSTPGYGLESLYTGTFLRGRDVMDLVVAWCDTVMQSQSFRPQISDSKRKALIKNLKEIMEPLLCPHMEPTESTRGRVPYKLNPGKIFVGRDPLLSRYLHYVQERLAQKCQEQSLNVQSVLDGLAAAIEQPGIAAKKDPNVILLDCPALETRHSNTYFPEDTIQDLNVWHEEILTAVEVEKQAGIPTTVPRAWTAANSELFNAYLNIQELIRCSWETAFYTQSVVYFQYAKSIFPDGMLFPPNSHALDHLRRLFLARSTDPKDESDWDAYFAPHRANLAVINKFNMKDALETILQFFEIHGEPRGSLSHPKVSELLRVYVLSPVAYFLPVPNAFHDLFILKRNLWRYLWECETFLPGPKTKPRPFILTHVRIEAFELLNNFWTLYPPGSSDYDLILRHNTDGYTHAIATAFARKYYRLINYHLYFLELRPWRLLLAKQKYADLGVQMDASAREFKRHVQKDSGDDFSDDTDGQSMSCLTYDLANIRMNDVVAKDRELLFDSAAKSDDGPFHWPEVAVYLKELVRLNFPPETLPHGHEPELDFPEAIWHVNVAKPTLTESRAPLPSPLQRKYIAEKRLTAFLTPRLHALSQEALQEDPSQPDRWMSSRALVGILKDTLAYLDRTFPRSSNPRYHPFALILDGIQRLLNLASPDWFPGRSAAAVIRLAISRHPQGNTYVTAPEGVEIYPVNKEGEDSP